MSVDDNFPSGHLTGDRTTGRLHLWALCWLAQEPSSRCNQPPPILTLGRYAGPDRQRKTILHDVRQNVLEVALDYLAVGIDSNQTTICVQSASSGVGRIENATLFDFGYRLPAGA